LEFLDNMNERAAHLGQANGHQLHLALAEALDPDAPISDYYRCHPWREDGGYLRALVEACRCHCASLPSYPQVRPLLNREARRTQVLALNHLPDPLRRDAALRDWAHREFPDHRHTSWFEITGAATGSLTIHALLALAAKPNCSNQEILNVQAAYFPGLSLIATMLDSYVDQSEDSVNANHSYIAHYATPELALQRLSQLISTSLSHLSHLPDGHRHMVIAASMVAMYLSRDGNGDPATDIATTQLLRAAGSLTKLLLPILRAWRIAYDLRSA
jgi:tetraprenyl-beta-curcumene synthase